MLPMQKYFPYILCAAFLAGCAPIQEMTKTLWGSSTRALEDARVDAEVKNFNCSYDSCFDAVVKLARKESQTRSYNNTGKTLDGLFGKADSTTATPMIDAADDTFDIFIKDYVSRHIVVLGIKGNVNTTEVGIFFTQIKPNETKIEISSLSTTAKEKVTRIVFESLQKLYP